MRRLREENHKLQSDYNELEIQFDTEVYNGGAWKKDKERLETKINDLTNAYESSIAARAEQQSQIVALHYLGEAGVPCSERERNCAWSGVVLCRRHMGRLCACQTAGSGTSVHREHRARLGESWKSNRE